MPLSEHAVVQALCGELHSTNDLVDNCLIHDGAQRRRHQPITLMVQTIVSGVDCVSQLAHNTDFYD
jgi:hypothetical protein